MSFVLRFTPTGLTTAKYDEIIAQLNAAGAGAPKGRSYHVCFGDPNNLFVSEIWENMEDFQAFGQLLIPIMHSLDLDPGQPVVLPVNNTIVA